MQYFLFDEFDLEISQSTISRALKRLGWSKKTVRLSSLGETEANCDCFSSRFSVEHCRGASFSATTGWHNWVSGLLINWYSWMKAPPMSVIKIGNMGGHPWVKRQQSHRCSNAQKDGAYCRPIQWRVILLGEFTRAHITVSDSTSSFGRMFYLFAPPFLAHDQYWCLIMHSFITVKYVLHSI